MRKITTTPFNVSVSEKAIEYIKKRVTSYPWHEMPDDGGWDYGTNLDYMKELYDYWVNEYDWHKHEATINTFSHFKAPVSGIDMHYILEKGSGDQPLLLLISHGCPGSFVESLDIIEILAHPERFGGKEEDAFDVIVPSLPGFGFSGRPPHPYGPRALDLTAYGINE
ncbi:MAG: hypothetical protein HOE30_27715 [Deltaproteobacteria bacterium]|jgi:hypothetical protein|nr:hypothetical protein [Deltaproteobacteria bacterium]MBT4263067.1 hypothetical protein [Deltaproteobacteria bacterium]MBT4643418.1 hypothetical protein [Deltaproteobacteria bacterium]MBT6499542.1 hypothetical protein [Deltaproteobacteria bacterium]MBT6612892.1 hypothetical protein [Deltaproteobacteria bacterium]